MLLSGEHVYESLCQTTDTHTAFLNNFYKPDPAPMEVLRVLKHASNVMRIGDE